MFVPLTVDMENRNESLNPQQSLDLITAMIQQAKGSVQKSSFYFLLWGWTIVACNLGVYALLKFTDVKNPYIVFAITIPVSIVSAIYGIRQDKKESNSTHLGEIHKWLWIGFGINCFIFAFLGKYINGMVNPVIILLAAVPTFVTGVILKFKPLYFGGIVFWVFGLVLFFVSREDQFLIAALAIALGYLVPGYMLKKFDR
jgi:hypothetical protein